MSNKVKMEKNLKQLIGVELNQPLYVYQVPMFLLTVSTVIIVENGVAIVKTDDGYRFPSTMIKAGKETIQFAALRNIKEEIGIIINRDNLIPIDFRSSPERSKEGNVVDIGMLYIADDLHVENCKGWQEVNFEKEEFVNPDVQLIMDHDILFQRSMEVLKMIR